MVSRDCWLPSAPLHSTGSDTWLIEQTPNFFLFLKSTLGEKLWDTWLSHYNSKIMGRKRRQFRTKNIVREVKLVLLCVWFQSAWSSRYCTPISWPLVASHFAKLRLHTATMKKCVIVRILDWLTTEQQSEGSGLHVCVSPPGERHKRVRENELSRDRLTVLFWN